MSPKHSHKFYSFHLPVFKQGDDFAHHLSKSKTLDEALESQAETYEWAADLCRKMAGAVRECPEIEMEGDTHWISVSGPEDRLEELARQELLSAEDDEFAADECEECNPELQDLDAEDDEADEADGSISK